MSITISHQNCEYRAEGNAGIVVRLIKEGKVLRLKKQDNVCKAISRADDILEELENQIKITRNVLKTILGKSFVHSPLIVFLRTEEIRMLNEIVSPFRPAHRRHKSVKEEDTYVTLLPDYCTLPQSLKIMPTYGPVLSIEIKPKQGFMKEEYLPSNLKSLPIPMCRFCMMQRCKLKTGVISSTSGYCPTDLFSGCYTRMFHALKMLCRTPQNNFRIFKNQKLIYSEEKRGDLSELLSDFFENSEKIRYTDLLSDLIIQALIKPFPHGMHKSPVTSQKKFSQNCINAHTLCSENDPCHELPHYCVLERILSSQLLDDLNIADLYQLYLKVKDSKDKSDFIGCYSRSEIPSYIGELRKNSSETEYQYASRKVWEFLMALSVKDCSIMLALRRLINSNIKLQLVIYAMYGTGHLLSRKDIWETSDIFKNRIIQSKATIVGEELLLLQKMSNKMDSWWITIFHW